MFQKVTVVGVGLIGGSLARVLKEKGLAQTIIGTGRSRESLEKALALGVIDRTGDLSDGVVDADLVVLAAPVGSFEKIAQEIGPRLKPGAIVTDVGSVKGALARRIEGLLPASIRYVAGHPIAGKERFGVAESSAALFRGAACILTPTDKTDPDALALVRAIWTAAGARVIEMDPDLHDHIFAAVSHLPHVAAFALMCAVAELNADGADYLGFSGAGFKDFTRIAASSPEMWRDICLLNRDNLIEMIDRFEFSLNRLKQDIIAEDGKRLEQHFQQASDARRRLG